MVQGRTASAHRAREPSGGITITEQRDSRARTTRMRYAAMGQLVEHVDPMGHRTRLHYDTELDLVAVENPAGDVYSFELDLAGRVTAEKTFSGTRRKFAHDKAGRTARIWTGAYRVTRLERDVLGRVVKQVAQGGRLDAPTQPVEETFANDEVGSLVAARTPSADVVFERDVLGRITREHEKIAATALTASITSRYDAAGLRVERRTSLAHKTDYQYNIAKRASANAPWAAPAEVPGPEAEKVGRFRRMALAEPPGGLGEPCAALQPGAQRRALEPRSARKRSMTARHSATSSQPRKAISKPRLLTISGQAMKICPMSPPCARWSAHFGAVASTR